MSDGLNFFTTINNFFSIWIISLKDKTEKKKWTHCIQKCITTHNVLTTLQTNNGKKFNNSIINQFWFERNIQHILKLLITSNTLIFYRTDLETVAKEQQKDYYSLNDSICDFLLQHNDRLRSTAKSFLTKQWWMIVPNNNSILNENKN